MYFYPFLDLSRRWLGSGMDVLGCGPVQTPSRVVLTRPGATLKAYALPQPSQAGQTPIPFMAGKMPVAADTGEAPVPPTPLNPPLPRGDKAGRMPTPMAGEMPAPPGGGGPVLLIVPAPIKRAYLWDLAPEVSVVRRCLEAGLRVYLVQWERPRLDDRDLGLADYADSLILECLEAVEAQTGRTQAFLAGHSLGGTLAAIFASLHPSRVQGLLLLEAPLRFGRSSVAFAPVVAASPRAGPMTGPLGNVPGSLLSAMSVATDPLTYGVARWMDFYESWPDPAALRTHLRVSRWTLDEMAMPRRLFEEIIELLYREDRFVRGELEINGRPARPAQMEAPLLSVVDPYSRVVPPESMLVFQALCGSEDARMLCYEGDVGVALQHAGVLVGRRAHHVLWPQILRWILARQKGRVRG